MQSKIYILTKLDTIHRIHNLFNFRYVSGKINPTVHQHRPRMYQKFLSVDQPIGVPSGKSGDTGHWEKGAAAVGVPEMGLKEMGMDAFLPFTMKVRLSSI